MLENSDKRDINDIKKAFRAIFGVKYTHVMNLLSEVVNKSNDDTTDDDDPNNDR